MHWRCLPKTAQDDILKAARVKDSKDENGANIPKRLALGVEEATEFVCLQCQKGGSCMICEVTVLEPEQKAVAESDLTQPNELNGDIGKDTEVVRAEEEDSQNILFRCVKCKRLAHYEHLPTDDNDRPIPDVATIYQIENEWQCADCVSFTFAVSKILAWRPYPTGATDPYDNSSTPPNYKEMLPREYLVKWDGRSYRRAQWVPHMWLSSTSPSLLRNFLQSGPKVELLAEPRKSSESFEDDSTKPADASELPIVDANDGSREAPDKTLRASIPHALPDAEERIPTSWLTIDRILDIRIWSPKKSKRTKQAKKKKATQISDDEIDELSSEAEDEMRRALDDGLEPDSAYIETIDEYESRCGESFSLEDIDKVIWAFIKWEDLLYDECEYFICYHDLTYNLNYIIQLHGTLLQIGIHVSSSHSKWHSLDLSPLAQSRFPSSIKIKLQTWTNGEVSLGLPAY